MRPGPHHLPYRSRSHWELAAAVALLVGSSSALFPLLYAANSVEADDVVWLRYLWLPVYALTILLATWAWRDLKGAVLGIVPTAVLLILTLASHAWSISPDTTLRRWEALAFNALLSFYLASRFTWADLVRIIASCFAVLAFGSMVMCVVFPSHGIHTDVNAGDWRGLWIQKNELGFMMVMGATSSLASAVIDPRRRLIWLANAGLCVFLLGMSRSGTSLLCLIASASLLAGFVLSRRRPAVAVVVVFLAGCALLTLAVISITDVDLLFKIMGKDPTLTGRTDVWTAVLRRIAERPALGYGYAAFWHDPNGPALLVRRETGWNVPTAHNGWLEVVLQLGWFGAAVLAAYVATIVTTAIAGLFSRRDGFWAIMFVGSFLMLSLSESELLRQNSLEWTLFMTTGTKLVIDLVRRRPVQAAPRIALAVSR